MAHDAEYAQKAFMKKKEDERRTQETTLHEVHRLQAAVARLEGMVSELLAELRELKAELRDKEGPVEQDL
ncbi:MAG: hypothetical protein PWQ57_3131 [Desulfovibrionales bacterium]|jgi:predicted RNase H-like nuclease (RuvC/YqgF family)|nr:hypothetical protein [Desulfovibrionales bacterium]